MPHQILILLTFVPCQILCIAVLRGNRFLGYHSGSNLEMSELSTRILLFLGVGGGGGVIKVTTDHPFLSVYLETKLLSHFYGYLLLSRYIIWEQFSFEIYIAVKFLFQYR